MTDARAWITPPPKKKPTGFVKIFGGLVALIVLTIVIAGLTSQSNPSPAPESTSAPVTTDAAVTHASASACRYFASGDADIQTVVTGAQAGTISAADTLDNLNAAYLLFTGAANGKSGDVVFDAFARDAAIYTGKLHDLADGSDPSIDAQSATGTLSIALAGARKECS